MPFNNPHHLSEANYVKENDRGYDIKPRGLNIIWGNDPRYWKILNNDIAELIQVSWLEASGQVPIEMNKKYVVKFDVEVKEDGFGWNDTQVLVVAKAGKNGNYRYKEVTLTPGDPKLTIQVESDALKSSVGSDVSEEDKILYFGLYEVWSGKWKGGLQIFKARVEPQFETAVEIH